MPQETQDFIWRVYGYEYSSSTWCTDLWHCAGGCIQRQATYQHCMHVCMAQQMSQHMRSIKSKMSQEHKWSYQKSPQARNKLERRDKWARRVRSCAGKSMKAQPQQVNWAWRPQTKQLMASVSWPWQAAQKTTMCLLNPQKCIDGHAAEDAMWQWFTWRGPESSRHWVRGWGEWWRWLGKQGLGQWQWGHWGPLHTGHAPETHSNRSVGPQRDCWHCKPAHNMHRADNVENSGISHSDIIIPIPDSRMVFDLIFMLFILLTLLLTLSK